MTQSRTLHKTKCCSQIRKGTITHGGKGKWKWPHGVKGVCPGLVSKKKPGRSSRGKGGVHPVGRGEKEYKAGSCDGQIRKKKKKREK